MIDIAAVTDELMSRANVVGVGIGYKTRGGEIVRDDNGDPIECVVVSVTRKLPAAQLPSSDVIPATVAGAPTDVIETGPITIIADLSTGETAAIDPQQRLRPIVPGLSVGLNPGVSAGTIGFIVEKADSSARYLLSNWHVISASNTPIDERDVLTITQPGNFDGGRVPGDVVARLAEFVPISIGGGLIPSQCDTAAAVARLLNSAASLVGSDTRLMPVVEVAAEGDNLVDSAIGLIESDFDRETPEIGVVTDAGTAELGMRVQKFGRTTGHTVGTITQINATFSVSGYPGGPAVFVDQLAITATSGSFLEGGDSGSGLVSMDQEAVGLCFAGSTAIGIANTWQNVATALNISLATASTTPQV